MKSSFLILLFIVVPILVTGCGSSGSSGSATGSIQFSWGVGAVPSPHRAPPPGGDVCEWYQITTIKARIYNSSNTEVASGSWACSAQGATVSGISVGRVSVSIDGVVAANDDWAGQASNIIVTANQTTNAGTINMSYVGNDTTAPTVSSVSPVDGAVDIALNTAITATFSEDVVVGSVTASTFLLDGGAVSGAVVYNAATRTATFTPAAQLSLSTLYTATITTGVEDMAGLRLVADYVWNFTTGTTPDTTAPMVISTSPANSATGVSVGTAIHATFSEAMDPATLDATTFVVDNGVTGAVTYDAGTTTATFTPSAPLNNSTVYTATITTGATDLAGNPLAADHSWSFTTEPSGSVTGTWDLSTWDSTLWGP